ncbi:MAG: L-fucose/L-arabinose isomerase family protein [Aeromicrobium sp.]
MKQRPVLGVIVGNRTFFPDALVKEGRSEILSLLEASGIDVVIVDEQATPLGAVETWQDAQICADLFRANADRIDGILVTLPNFGDEGGVSDAIRLSGLHVPILVQAYPDDIDQFGPARRRDSFCGKISVCNNLTQYGYPFSLTELHTVAPGSESFGTDLRRFIGTCNVVNGMRRARLGMVGTRPSAFRTVRFSEKLLEASGVSVSVIDLSDVHGAVGKIGAADARVKDKIEAIRTYVDTAFVPPEPLERMAKFAVVLDEWMQRNGLQATAIQCWDSMQNNFGFNACTVMSMMSNNLLPSACETDVTGLTMMYALQLASGRPSALADWNNNYGGDPDKCVFWHCGTWAKALVPDERIDTSPIHSSLGIDNTWGALHGRAPAGAITFGRITTDDARGEIRAFVGEGSMTDDPLDTYGTRAVVNVPGLQGLLKLMCLMGFEHHVAMNGSEVAYSVAQAFDRYLGWTVYRQAEWEAGLPVPSR